MKGGNKSHTFKSEGRREQVCLNPSFRADDSSFCLSESAYFYIKASYAFVEIVLQT
jgi:hypothetical protein